MEPISTTDAPNAPSQLNNNGSQDNDYAFMKDQDSGIIGGGGGASTNQQKQKKEAVYEQSGNTITVQSTKVIGEYNYSFVSVSPTKRALVDNSMLKKIKIIQSNDLKTWKGLVVEYISRPGSLNTYQSRKMQKAAEYFKMEDERFRIYLEGLLRFKEWEEERINQVYQFQPNNANASKEQQNSLCLRGAEYIVFKPLKDSSILMREGPLMLNYQKSAGVGGNIGTAVNGFGEQQYDLLFKLVKTDARLIRAVLENNAFSQTEGHDWNILWTCQSQKPCMYEGLNDNQKINHFPQSYELTRKDRLCYNIVQMQDKFGKEDFDIIPDTYILPDEFADFYSHFHKLKTREQSNLWIIKPQNSSQGKGIFIIDDISEVPIDESCIVSKYITNPFLINGLKFDLRIYVLVTSLDPWRIYVYNEGLARFASEPYAAQTSKQNKYAHLTNYSINKKNDKYVPNMAADQDDAGHKWSFAALTKHMEQIGVDMNLLWSKIYDVILKSLLSVDSTIYQNLKKLPNKNNCFELLGYDILIDSDLKPWLMEVNLSPSLATDTPLDLKIKTGLMLDTFNLVGVKKFDRRRDNLTKMKNRVKNIMRAKSYQSRQQNPSSVAPSKNLVYGGAAGDDKSKKRDEYHNSSENDYFNKNKLLFEKISQMNSRFREMVRDTLQEHVRKNEFIRIYPAKNSDIYEPYFVTPRPSNKFLHRYLYSDEVIPFPPGYPNQQNRQENFMNGSISKMEDNLTIIEQLSSNDVNGNYNNTQHLTSSVFNNPVIGHHQHNISQGDFTKAGGGRTSSANIKNRQESAGNSKKQSQTQVQGASNNQNEQQKEKLLITGDDVLIEYVSRLMIAVKSIKEQSLRPLWKNQLEKFIKHYVWHSSDMRRAENNKLWQRLESRLIEMKERRKRLLKSLYKKENPQATNQVVVAQKTQSSLTTYGVVDFEKEYQFKEDQKNVIIQGFSAAQLEEMLRTSTKNVAYEVISCLIDQNNKGVLTEIIKWLTTCNQNLLNDNESVLDQLSKKRGESAESDEEPESYMPSNPKGDNISSTSGGQASIGSGNSGDIRIKIRKNSMEPHSKLKANHSHLLKQKMLQKDNQSELLTLKQQRSQQSQFQGSGSPNKNVNESSNFQSLNNSPQQKISLNKINASSSVNKDISSGNYSAMKVTNGMTSGGGVRAFEEESKEFLIKSKKNSNKNTNQERISKKVSLLGVSDSQNDLTLKMQSSLEKQKQSQPDLYVNTKPDQAENQLQSLSIQKQSSQQNMLTQNSTSHKQALSNNIVLGSPVKEGGATSTGNTYFKTYATQIKVGELSKQPHIVDTEAQNIMIGALQNQVSQIIQPTMNTQQNQLANQSSQNMSSSVTTTSAQQKKQYKVGRKTYSSTKKDSSIVDVKRNPNLSKQKYHQN